MTPLENIRLVNSKANAEAWLELGQRRFKLIEWWSIIGGINKELAGESVGLWAIFKDEPTGNLDPVTATEIIEILKNLAKREINGLLNTYEKVKVNEADTFLELKIRN